MPPCPAAVAAADGSAAVCPAVWSAAVSPAAAVSSCVPTCAEAFSVSAAEASSPSAEAYSTDMHSGITIAAMRMAIRIPAITRFFLLFLKLIMYYVLP